MLESDSDTIKHEWGHQFHMSQGTKHSKGLLLLFGKSIDFDKTNVLHKSDRFLISNLQYCKGNIFIGNIYGPRTDAEKSLFLNKLQNIINPHLDSDTDDNLVILGDMNIVKSNEMDIIAGNPHSINIVKKFNNVTNELQLHDVWRINNPNKKIYTWCRKNPFTARRLDYIFTSTSLFYCCRDAGVKNIGFSDHKICTLILDFSTFKRGPSTYKLNTDILNHKNFIDEVKIKINNTLLSAVEHNLDPHLTWELIKVEIRAESILFSKNLAKNNNVEKNELTKKLSFLEEEISLHPEKNYIFDEILLTKKKLEVFCIKESQGAQIRAGVKYAEQGEKNNKFFLSLEKQRSKNNTIFNLKSIENNSIITGSDDILDHIFSFYKNLYKDNPHPKENYDELFINPNNVPKLDVNQIALLENDVTEAEVLSSLKSMKNGSSPGLDGLPIEVYKVLWNDIKIPFMNSLKYSYTCGNLSSTQKQGIMCLLHKNDTDRELISNWRPLSLTNTDYKLIAKIFARRINLVINTLIDTNQFAFIKGRTISTMLREIDDIFERERHIRKGSIILSIDYAKAFDSLSLNTIQKALNIYGFGDYFKKWIDVLLSNRMNCVRNGGYVSSLFNMERGVRQGCPISPLLFIMAVELFACNIRKDDNICGLQYNHDSRSLKIRLYADDITLFLRDMMDFREVLSKIKKFSKFSGLCLNLNKTLAVRFGVESWVGIFKSGIRFVDQIKILGIFFSISVDTQSILKNFTSKIENLERICHLWSKRKLSLIG